MLIGFALALYLFYGPIPSNNEITVVILVVVLVLVLWAVVLFVFDDKNNVDDENKSS